MLMGDQLGNSRTWRVRVFPTQRTNRWDYIQVYGMLMTGQQEEDLWRQIGAKLRSLLLSGTSEPMGVFGPMGFLLAASPTTLLIMLGYPNSWILQTRRGLNGCRRITWFTITALTLSDSLRVSLWNALSAPRHKRNTTHSVTYVCILFFFSFLMSIPSYRLPFFCTMLFDLCSGVIS